LRSCVAEQDFGIYVATADGSGAIALNKPFPLDSTAGEGDATFSPDGKSVAFVRFVDDSRGAVWVVPAAGGEARRLTSDDFGAAYPRWSPDGKSILFAGRTSPGAADCVLWVVPAAGDKPRRVFNPDASIFELEGDWSVDGSPIVFKVFENGWDHNELRVASADGTHERTRWVGTQSTAETPHWGSIAARADCGPVVGLMSGGNCVWRCTGSEPRRVTFSRARALIQAAQRPHTTNGWCSSPPVQFAAGCCLTLHFPT
jgi:Tol biopolymer transport system component